MLVPAESKVDKPVSGENVFGKTEQTCSYLYAYFMSLLTCFAAVDCEHVLLTYEGL